MVEVGSIFEGRVVGLKPFGAFVALPEGRVGMVHISEVANEYVRQITDVLHEGDIVRVQVINIAPDGKIALSMKRLLPPPPPRAPRPPREDRPPRNAGPRPDGPRGEGRRAPRNDGPRNEGGPREGGSRAPRGGARRDAEPRVWQPRTPARSDNMSFEDMMSRFKSQSEEKMADLDHEANNRRGGGYAPRGHRGR